MFGFLFKHPVHYVVNFKIVRALPDVTMDCRVGHLRALLAMTALCSLPYSFPTLVIRRA